MRVKLFLLRRPLKNDTTSCYDAGPFQCQASKSGIITGRGIILQWPTQQEQFHPHQADGA